MGSNPQSGLSLEHGGAGRAGFGYGRERPQTG